MLTYANEEAGAILKALGWRPHQPLPEALREATRRVRADSPVAFDLCCNEDAYSLVASLGYGGYFVHICGTRIIAGIALAEAMPHLVWSRDSAGRALYLNKKWRDYTGLSVAQENRRGWEELYHPKDMARFRALWSWALANGTAFEGEFRYRRHDGAYRWFLARAVPVHDVHGRMLKWVGTATDIHDHRIAAAAVESARRKLRLHTEKLEKTVAERTAALRQSLSESQAFTNAVAHDLKGPLSAIRNFTKGALQHEGLPAETAEDLGRVVHTAERMESFVTNLMQFGRLAHQEQVLETVNLAALIRGLIQERPELMPPLAQIEVQDSAILVRGDTISLAQCVSNLLGNAVKFVAPNTLPQVRIFAEFNGKHVRVVFQDNGIGIHKKFQSAIFEPFRRAASGDYEGNGLGLAIVQRAVTRMHGRVGVDSEPGKGSRFWLELPEP